MKNAFKLFIIVLTFFTISTGYVLAKEGQSMEVSLSANKNTYNVGDEILINVSIDQIKGFSGLSIFIGSKVYNEDSLEYIETTVSNNNWELVAEGEKVLLKKTDGEDLKKGEICTLKFKALKEGNTIVKIDEIDACNDDGDVYYEDGNVNSPSIEIKVENREASNNKNETSKSYIGIILITIGILGIVAVGVHYIINKKKI